MNCPTPANTDWLPTTKDDLIRLVGDTFFAGAKIDDPDLAELNAVFWASVMQRVQESAEFRECLARLQANYRSFHVSAMKVPRP